MGVEGSFADLLRKCAWNGVGGGVGIGRIGHVAIGLIGIVVIVISG